MELLLFKVGGQRSRSFCHIVGKRGRIHSRQETDGTISSRVLKLGTFDQYNEWKMLIVFQDRKSKVKVELSQSRKTWQDTS